MKIPKKAIKKWIKALRSGKFKQTRETLEDSAGFCCLGVACKVFIPEKKLEYAGDYLQGAVPDSEEQPHAPKWLQEIDDDFKERTGNSCLTELNDSGKSFKYIANRLEKVYLKTKKKKKHG